MGPPSCVETARPAAPGRSRRISACETAGPPSRRAVHVRVAISPASATCSRASASSRNWGGVRSPASTWPRRSIWAAGSSRSRSRGLKATSRGSSPGSSTRTSCRSTRPATIPQTGFRVLCMPFFGGANLAQVLDTAGGLSSSGRTGRSLVEALDQISRRHPPAASELARPISRPRSSRITRSIRLRRQSVRSGAGRHPRRHGFGACLGDRPGIPILARPDRRRRRLARSALGRRLAR